MGISNLSKAVKKLETVDIQGATEIAIFSLKTLRRIVKRKGFGKEFNEASRKLERARPTAVVLHNCLNILKQEKTIDSINRLIETLETSDEKISENGIKCFGKKSYRLLTHCHSSEAIAMIKGLKNKGKNLSVIVTQTDPLEQGIKTAKELSGQKIPTTLIIDSAVGHFINDIDAFVFGTDAIRKEGIVNKIGTKLYAIAAKENKKPVYIVGNNLKLDRRREFEMEQRSPNEIKRELSRPYDLRGIVIKNPAFDITPWKYVTRVITEEGVFTPSQIQRMLR